MRRAYKFRLYPNKQQEKKLFWTLARCRELYNAAVEERRESYRIIKKSTSYNSQSAQLPAIKLDREEYQQVYSQILQDVLRRVNKAFDNFFRRIENHETPGYPRFQGRNRYNSFTYPQNGFRLTYSQTKYPQNGRISLSKIGDIKTRVHRKVEGRIKTCTIKYEAGQWYIILSCEIAAPHPKSATNSQVGIDLGTTHFAALSDGSFIEYPRYYRKSQNKLAKLQKSLSRKKRGSHRREKARARVAKTHRRIRNQRRDFQHKQSTRLVNEHQTIVFEQLEVRNLTKHAKTKQDEKGTYLPNGASTKSGLTKSILDAGWASFQQLCVSKAAYAGRTVLFVDPRYTSQVCSQCGTVHKKTLEERWHSCECGCELDRDTNAAINILRLGRSQRGATCVEAPGYGVLHHIEAVTQSVIG